MFSLLERHLPAAGRVLFPGAIPPPLESLVWPAAVDVARRPASDELAWHVEVEHQAWGRAEVAAFRHTVDPDPFVAVACSLTDAEKAEAERGSAAIGVRLTSTRAHVLRDRKHLLRWLQLLLAQGGVIAFDDCSMLPWSAAMLDDELAHDAMLDVEALYALHAVKPDGASRVTWLHTHGLGDIGAFDFDVLEPSEQFQRECATPFRSLACAALEGAIRMGEARYEMAHPGGEVRLVPVDEFAAKAAPAHRALRDDDAAHAGARVVLCEPVSRWFGAWRQQPTPSRFLSTVDVDRLVFPFSEAAGALSAERARLTVPALRGLAEEFRDLELPVLLKMGYDTDGGSREHLWFECHELFDDHADATLVNAPFDISGMKEGDRAMHAYERLSDWQVLSPAGSMTPRNISAARIIREHRDAIAAQMRSARGPDARG